MRCVLVGNYGAGNLGDDLLKEYFLKAFPDVQWTVASAAPSTDEVPRLPFGLRSFLTTPWWKTIRALRQSDAVVFGGGSLFTDIESVKACLLWWWHARVARFFGKPVLLAFQGIGPFTTSVGEWCARDTVKHVAFVSVRDAESVARAGAWARVVESFDPVIMLFANTQRTLGSENILGLIPRENSGEEFFAAVDSAMKAKQPESVRILSLQPDSPSERRCCTELTRRVGARTTLYDVRTAQGLTDALSPCSHIVTERYHGALAALAMKIPMDIVVQQSGDKLDVVRRSLQSGVTVEVFLEGAKSGELELQKYISML